MKPSVHRAIYSMYVIKRNECLKFRLTVRMRTTCNFTHAYYATRYQTFSFYHGKTVIFHPWHYKSSQKIEKWNRVIKPSETQISLLTKCQNLPTQNSQYM